MNDLMNICKEWLCKRYNEYLPSENEPFKWLRVTRDNFRLRTDNPDEQSPAIIQDNQLGLLLVLIPIEKSWDTNTIKMKVEADLHGAISLRSLLLLKDTGKEIDKTHEDDKGTWRVCIHWLVPDCHVDNLKANLLFLRQKSSLFEEVPVDIIRYMHHNTLNNDLTDHGFPRLLLITRHVFNQKSNEVVRWAGADEKIRAALHGFSSQFIQKTEKSIAENIEQLAGEFQTNEENHYPEKPCCLDHFEIRNFRSIKHLTLMPWSSERKAQSWVIHGPNGTGKTSLAEALSLCFFGASSRYHDYLDDPDISSSKNADGYVSQYLKPMRDTRNPSGEEPYCKVGDKEFKSLAVQMLNSKNDVAHALNEKADGVLSIQEETRKFIQLPGDDLAARMSQSFSKLAEIVNDFVDKGSKQAQDRRLQFLSGYGLTAQIKLQETIRNRIAQNILMKSRPGISNNNSIFLKLLANFENEDGKKARDLLKRLDSDTTIEETVKRISRLDPAVKEDRFCQEILSCFQERYASLILVEELIQRFRSRNAATTGVDLSDIIAQAEIWAKWLSLQTQNTDEIKPIDNNLKELQEKLNKLSLERKEITDNGQALRPQHEYLSQTIKFIETHWIKEHSDTCPTCHTTFPEGILNIISPFYASLEEKLTHYRERYKILTDEMRNLENSIKALGHPQCPVSQESRDRINSLLDALLEDHVSAESLLLSSDHRPHILTLLKFAQTPPSSIEEPRDPLLDANECAKTIMEQWQKAGDLSEEPDAWISIKKTITEVLKKVLEEHLPTTIQAIWWEIAACLTPAVWLLPDRPKFRAETKRNSQRLDIVIQGRLARHILNNAEQHILGLAWFFTQHVIKGRFRHAWILLDDPAQEMDQPTYRDLCRFLATLLRMYKTDVTNENPFTLVLLLHQEQRALDAAREMDSGLYLLGWSDHQTDKKIPGLQTIRRILLAGPTFHSPLPDEIFASTC